MGRDGRDRSRSRGKARKDRSLSRSASRGKKKAAKGARSPSRKKTQKKRSPSRKRGRQSSSPEQVKEKSAPASSKGSYGKGAAKGKKGLPSPEREQRASPSYDRGGRSPGSDASRSRSGSLAPKASPKEMEVVEVQLKARPFGMAPSKEDGVSGYVVSKVADDKPADEAGVRPGWRVVSVAGKSCADLGLEAIQGLLKGADLPMAVEFEREKEDAPKADEDDSDEEIDILDARAEYRHQHQSGLDLLDELPVTRSPEEELPPPIKNWQDACDRKILNKMLMEKLQAAGLKRPTLIQRHAVPIISHESGYWDMICSAQTGSGKTFAFVIPTVARLLVQGVAPRPFFPGNMAQAQPLILVLSPTRELAMQTAKEIEVLTKGSKPTVESVCLYGGESLKYQQKKLTDKQTDVICSTPGRLIDLIDAGKVSLTFIQSVVLDEADQMLEQSLEIMCMTILTGKDMPPPEGRQTLLFSATMPQKIKDMCPKILRQAQKRIANITVGHYNADKGGACAGITQILRWVPEEKERTWAMIEDLKRLWIGRGKKGRVVIFTNQRIQAGNLANALQSNGITCSHLHGKLEQHVREEVFDKFRKGLSDVLVATNVASRGLDFPDISLVAQYNMPANVDIYTHRIGRTGRVGQVGDSLAYVGPKDKHLFPKLIEFLELNNQDVPSFLQSRDRGNDRWGSGGGYDRGRRGGGYESRSGGYDRDRRGGSWNDSHGWNDRGGGDRRGGRW